MHAPSPVDMNWLNSSKHRMKGCETLHVSVHGGMNEITRLTLFLWSKGCGRETGVD